MKKSFLLFIKSFVFTSLLLCFFVGYGYLFLNSGALFTEVKENKIQYYESKPKNVDITINHNVILFLDFQKDELRVLFLKENNIFNSDFYLNCNIDILSDLIDLLGGIELSVNEENLSFTGTQLKDIIYSENIPIYKETTYQIIEKVSQKGLLQEDVFNIIKNSETNITVNDCFDWYKYLKNMCINVLFLN